MSGRKGGLGLLENPQHSLKFLSEIEEMGEDILRDRQEIVALDRRRNQNREALRAISSKGSKDKIWMSIGSLLVKFPEEKAKKMLENDQVQVDVEINKMRSELKLKVNKLRDMEHKSPVPGLSLVPLSSLEMGAIKTGMGIRS